MKFISYAQNFEDFILWRALKDVKDGFYIDVGAFDPKEDSVTKSFYDIGWFGINIDPVVSYYKKFLIERPRDTNLNILISDKEGEVVFFENSKTGISSAVEDNIKKWEAESNYKFEKIIKIAKTLDGVCAENDIKTVHFLKIDVEGFELNVLKSLSFDTVRPWIVLFEAVSPVGEHEDISEECTTYLKSKKYHQVYFDGLNKFFVADEHASLDEAFKIPVNIFDHTNLRLSDSHWLIRENINEIKIKKDEEILIEEDKLKELEKSLAITQNQLKIADQEINQYKIKVESTEQQLNENKEELNLTVTELNSTKKSLEIKTAEVNEIYSSRAWKVISIFHKLNRKLTPKGSLRRKIVKKLWKIFKYIIKLPFRILRKLKKLIFVHKKLVNHEPSEYVTNELETLSPRARKIYEDLKKEIGNNKNK